MNDIYRDYNLARVRRCPIDIYVASNMPYPYPYKLGKPEHAELRVRDRCTTWIMDSGIGNEDMTNEEVMAIADKYDADFVVPKDYLHDQQRTTESVKQFLDLYASADLRAIPLIPLQPPHDEHYRDLPGHFAYMLGGMAFDYTPREQISAIESFRQVAGPSPYVHALGIGGSMTVVRAVANNPGMIQSLDCSTPEQAALNGAIMDAQLKQRQIEILNGEGSSNNRNDLAATNAYQLNDAYTRAARSEMSLAGFE